MARCLGAFVRSNPSFPSLLSLRAFDAVARHGSMTGATNELLVTQSAVSHHIRALETELGIQLFTRHARGIALTDAGVRYHEAIEVAFATMTSATNDIRATAASPSIRVSVLPSFAAHWLMPRLARFRARHPSVLFELDSTLGHARFDSGIDLAIRYGAGIWPGHEAKLLMQERLAPVVAASSANRVETLPLLMTSKGFEWQVWSAAAEQDLAATTRLQLTDYNVAVQAALNGQGLAMGRLRLIQERLDSGELVAPYGAPIESPSAAYWCVHPSDRRLSDATACFIAWIEEEVAAA